MLFLSGNKSVTYYKNNCFLYVQQNTGKRKATKQHANFVRTEILTLKHKICWSMRFRFNIWWNVNLLINVSKAKTFWIRMVLPCSFLLTQAKIISSHTNMLRPITNNMKTTIIVNKIDTKIRNKSSISITFVSTQTTWCLLQNRIWNDVELKFQFYFARFHFILY